MKKTGENTRIRTLEKRELEAAKALWLACFSEDDAAFVEFYFNSRTVPQRMLGLFVSNAENCEKLVSMLCYEPLEMRVSKWRNAQVGFVAGVCTFPQYRRRGYVRLLLSELETRLAVQGFEALLLRPFNFAFYEKLGFAAFAKRRMCELHADASYGLSTLEYASNTAIAFELDATSMRRIYSDYTANICGSFIRTEEKSAAVMQEFSLAGGRSLAVKTAEGEAYALWWSSDYDETCCANSSKTELEEFAFTDIASALALIGLILNETKGICIPLPASEDLLKGEGRTEPFNMIKPIGGRRFDDFIGGCEPFDFQKY